MRFRVLQELHLHLGYQWMPKLWLKADIFFEKVVGLSKRPGILLGKPRTMCLCKRTDLIDKGEL